MTTFSVRFLVAKSPIRMPTRGPRNASFESFAHIGEAVTTFSCASSVAKSPIRMPTRFASACLQTGTRRRGGKAEVALVNTCCVTREAVGKSRQAAAKAARTHKRVYVTGCGAGLDEAFADWPRTSSSCHGRDRSVGARGEHARLGPQGRSGTAAEARARLRDDPGRLLVSLQLLRRSARSRPGRSKPAEAVLGEVRRRVEQGHKEVVLSGINLGCFRDSEAGISLAALVREAGRLPARTLAPLLDRGQPPGRRPDRRHPRDACRLRHLHVPCNLATTGFCTR